MSEEGRRRAGQVVADAMGARGWNAVDVAHLAEISDPATVRTFVAGESYPWPSTRGKIERALGLEPGFLDRVAKGTAHPEDANLGHGLDPVERAIQSSPDLSKGQKHRLLGQYSDMIEGRESHAG